MLECRLEGESGAKREVDGTGHVGLEGNNLEMGPSMVPALSSCGKRCCIPFNFLITFERAVMSMDSYLWYFNSSDKRL